VNRVRPASPSMENDGATIAAHDHPGNRRSAGRHPS
jgi:hypothetical protein